MNFSLIPVQALDQVQQVVNGIIQPCFADCWLRSIICIWITNDEGILRVNLISHCS